MICNVNVFLDPVIKITYVGEDTYLDSPYIDPVINVSCHTYMTAGEPAMALEFSGNEPDQFHILKTETNFQNHSNYYNGSLLAMIRFPHKGRFVCLVTDKRRQYSTSQKIDLTGKLSNL